MKLIYKVQGQYLLTVKGSMPPWGFDINLEELKTDIEKYTSENGNEVMLNRDMTCPEADFENTFAQGIMLLDKWNLISIYARLEKE